VKIIETKLKGAFIIEPELLQDERGFFARSWCQKEFADRGLNPNLRQCNISFNKKKGTLRGVHYQARPFEEAKLMRCTSGALFDVIVDIRRTSKTYLQWLAVELSAANYRMLYAPEGFAHGFQTLVDNTEIFYQMSEFYSPAHSRGFRYDDPVIRISWPLAVSCISARDRSLPELHSVNVAVTEL
jgi:dTDP-4-dehydrorhamnose 3,5-epimerase